MISTIEKNKTVVSLIIGKHIDAISSIMSCMDGCKFKTLGLLNPDCKKLARSLFADGYEYVHKLNNILYISFYDNNDVCYFTVRKKAFEKTVDLWISGEYADDDFEKCSVRSILNAVTKQIPLTNSPVNEAVLCKIKDILGVSDGIDVGMNTAKVCTVDDFMESSDRDNQGSEISAGLIKKENQKKILSRKLSSDKIIKTNKTYKIQATVTSMQMRRLSVLGVEFESVVVV